MYLFVLACKVVTQCEELIQVVVQSPPSRKKKISKKSFQSCKLLRFVFMMSSFKLLKVRNSGKIKALSKQSKS